MLLAEHDLYALYKTTPSFRYQAKQFIKERGVELTITLVGLFIGLATVLVSYQVGKNQEILQASRMTDSYFNGITELFARTPEENQQINLLIIARTEAIIEDLNHLNKPDKLASIIAFVSNLKPKLFYKDLEGQSVRSKYIYLGKINLAHSSLRNLNLENARFSYSNLVKADLSHSNLQTAVLKNANLKNANLNYVNLNQANLQGANLNGASIYLTSFENANLENTIWVNGIRCKKGSIGHCVY